MSHPLAGTFIFAGNVGIGQITITMATDRTVHDVAADGSIMVSYIAGDNGQITLEMQQTSDLHDYLLSWYNSVRTAANAGDTANWAAASVALRSISDGSIHNLSGVSPSKVPDKTYAQQGGRVTWSMHAANISNE